MSTELVDRAESKSNGLSDFQGKSDTELVTCCLEGDDRAWAALLERYGALIYSIARRSRLPHEDVADVFQSVCLSMLDGLKQLRDGTKLSSWLITVTLRQCQKARRRIREVPVGVNLAQQELFDVADDSPLQDEQIQLLEQERIVQQGLKMMREPCRRLLTYLFYEKELWSYEEIAKDLSLSPSAIGAKRGRCLKDLLKILNQLQF